MRADVAPRCDYAVNEGAGDRLDFGGSIYYLCSTAEKMTAPFNVRVHGRSGHASMPGIADNALVKAAVLIQRIAEYRPGPQAETQEDLVRAAGDIGTTIFHPVGTAKMGPDNDPLAVLDERLRVRGIAALRVIDASAMPRITSGNTNSPTVMIAEKGAAMLLEDAR